MEHIPESQIIEGEIGLLIDDEPGKTLAIDVLQAAMGRIGTPKIPTPQPDVGPQQSVTNTGIEFFKIKAPDMLGTSQWQVLRNGRTVRVAMLHRRRLAAYQARKFSILPGDSLKGVFEESITYDAMGNELKRKLAIVEVLDIISPAVQQALI